jgi:tetratricopeptide (TPR) repeat protein
MISQGDYAAGKQLLQDLVELRPDSVTLLRLLAGYAIGAGELVEGWHYASQSYALEPDSPAVIETLAGAWLNLGAYEEAERLLLDGLEIAGDNFGLQNSYFFLLLRQGRLEKAENLLLSQFGSDIEALPEQLQQFYYFQKGMIRFVAGDLESAGRLVEQAVAEEAGQAWNESQIMVMTISSALLSAVGNAELAEQRLTGAERAARRARINGVDDANINYTESSIFALRGNAQAALEKLQVAYARGFRQVWLMDLDPRLEAIQQEPKYLELKDRMEQDIAEARALIESMVIAAL